MPQVYPDFSTGFANLGTAMFGDPKVIAQSRAAAAEEEYRKGMLANAQRELDLKAPVFDAQRQQAIASAGYDNSRAKQVELQTRGSSELGDVLANSIVIGSDGRPVFKPENFGRAAAQAVMANPNGDVSNMLGGLMAMMPNQTEDSMRQAAAVRGDMPSANTAFTVGQSDRLAGQDMAAKVAVQREANNADLYKPIIVPDGSTVFSVPNDPRFPDSSLASIVAPQTQPQASPLGSAPQIQAPTGPYRDPATGSTVVPKQGKNELYTNSQYGKFLSEFSDAALTAQNAADSIRQLTDNPEAVAASVNPVGGIPLLGSGYRWLQGFSNDPKLVPQLRFMDASISDWLSKSKDLKGAITERETAMLRASQPPENASGDQKMAWLKNAQWASQMEADWQNAKQQAVSANQPFPNAIEWKRAYLQANPMPDLFGKAQQGQQSPQQSLSNIVAPKSEPVPAGMDPNIWNYMTPQEKALFNQ